MIFERIESEGLAHYSYLMGDQREAVVVDPRRDCDVYLERAYEHGLRIKYILETHRNEDYVVGSVELACRTDAEIWHADAHLEYQYGRAVEDGQTFDVGRLGLRAIHSPGHTLGSMSYLLHDPSGAAWMVLTGDALFAGDVGRVDFMGMERAEELASLLYDTVFSKLVPLGDGVIVCPAHGAGSACGSAIADRLWTTIGLERQLNPRLQLANEAEFVAEVAKELERPPYFAQMEQHNLKGAPLLGQVPLPTPLAPDEFAEKAKQGIVLDTRRELGFGSAHVPGALSIWLDGVPRFAGWFLPYDQPILLVSETQNPILATRYLIRVGYDDLAGYLSGGMVSWHTAGLESKTIRTVTVQRLCRLLDEGEETAILDVRSKGELESAGRIPNAQHIHITQLPDHFQEVPRDRTVYIFCASDKRAMLAASFLQREGWDNGVVVLGGLAGWNSITCPLG